MLNPNDIYSHAESLYIDEVITVSDNPYKEDVYLIYNPDGYGGVLVVGKEIIDIIKLCNGYNTIKQISLSVNQAYENLLTIFNLLVSKQIIYSVKTSQKNYSNKKKVLTCWIHLTNNCNLKCKYCYIHKNSDVMSEELLFSSIDKMLLSCKKHNYDILSLMLVGGEPLTQFKLIKSLIDYCESNPYDVPVKYIIPTNGTLVSKDIARFIKDKEISVGVSLDGSKEYHDVNRIYKNGRGSYEDTIKGINNLIEHNIKPSIMVTVTAENLEGLPKLTKYLIEKEMFFRFSFERDTQTGHPRILNDISKCIRILNECFDIMEQYLNSGSYNWFFQFGDVTFSKPVRRACAAGKNFFALGQNGEIACCSLGLEAPRTNIINIKDIISEIDDIFSDISHTSACDVNECKICEWRHSCAGACPLQTSATYGDLLHISPYCELYKSLLPRVLKIYAISIYYKNKFRERGGVTHVHI